MCRRCSRRCGREIARANELLISCKPLELAASGVIPPGPEGAPLRATVEEALKLAVELQEARRSAVSRTGASRRALGAYAKKAAAIGPGTKPL